MQIYKFGGASVKNAEAVINLSKIISGKSKLVVVVSAIDKTTNALEKLCNAYYYNLTEKYDLLSQIKDFHYSLYYDLIKKKPDNSLLGYLFEELSQTLSTSASDRYDFEYDRIVSYGELFSSAIIYDYLSLSNSNIKLIDVRDYIITNDIYREANVDWSLSQKRITELLNNNSDTVYLTQGFIAGTDTKTTTTLGREGSDFTAAIFAYLLNAKDITIWKDVPGIMNADPLKCKFAEKIELLSYQEAIELAFFGAKVIHPKTIKPLQNKSIPLYVKSFLSPEGIGTVIKKVNYKLKLIPIYIIKESQILISISPKDFSFIVEKNISKIFELFVRHRIKVNLTQNSAISYSASVDSQFGDIDELIKDLQKEFTVKYNENLELITIRHFTPESLNNIVGDKKIMLEQRSRNTARFIVKN